MSSTAWRGRRATPTVAPAGLCGRVRPGRGAGAAAGRGPGAPRGARPARGGAAGGALGARGRAAPEAFSSQEDGAAFANNALGARGPLVHARRAGPGGALRPGPRPGQNRARAERLPRRGLVPAPGRHDAAVAPVPRPGPAAGRARGPRGLRRGAARRLVRRRQRQAIPGRLICLLRLSGRLVFSISRGPRPRPAHAARAGICARRPRRYKRAGALRNPPSGPARRCSPRPTCVHITGE